MSTIRCFWLFPTTSEKRYLRRYAGGKCDVAPMGYHDARVEIEPGRFNERAGLHPRDDPRWPTHCACGRAFRPQDEWQLFAERIYVRADTGEETTLREVPAGAMWDADWMAASYAGPDGFCLVVKTPGGEWMVDGPEWSVDGARPRGWTRSGTVPNVTAHPSILIPGRYHGWLRDGCLVEC